MVMSWFSLSIIALAFFGIQKFLFKVVAEKGCSMMQTTAFFMGTVAALSFLGFALYGDTVGNIRFLLIIAVANGTIFLAATVFRMKTLRYLPGTIAYPLYQLSLILVVLFGVVYFHDQLGVLEGGGILLGIAATPLLSQATEQTGQGRWNFRTGLLLALGATIATAMSEILSKFVAVSSSDLLLFIGLSYTWNLVVSGSYSLIPHPRRPTASHWKTTATYGILIGITNLIAFYAELTALRTGPLSNVTLLSSLSIVVAMLLSAWIYRERLDRKGKLGASLAVLSIVLLGIRA